MSIYKKLFEVKKTGIKLQRDVKAFNYKYATLDQIQSKLNTVFQEQWLVIVHQIENNKVITKIVDTEDDTYLISEIDLSEWIKPQDKWSEITYYRRYNLLCLLDLEVEDDDWKKAQDSRQVDSRSGQDIDKTWITDDKIKSIAEYILKWNEVKFTDLYKKYKISKKAKTNLEEIGVK